MKKTLTTLVVAASLGLGSCEGEEHQTSNIFSIEEKYKNASYCSGVLPDSPLLLPFLLKKQ
jgi:hypothetical protein